MDERKGDWIQTFTGRKFWPLDPRPDEIDVCDIAHAISMQCRFSGHTREFLSVAQHSVIVSLACEPADALWGLLHDAAEAYLVDLPRPIKRQPEMEPYRMAEARVMAAVCHRFGLSPEMPRSVKIADERVLAAEAYQFMNLQRSEWKIWRDGVEPWPREIIAVMPQTAERDFLDRFRELGGHA